MDLYQQLGLKRGASEDEIKKAYRSLAKQLHPDRNKDNPNAAERFGKVTAAYDILSDKDKRARYDRGEIDEEGNPKSPFGGGFGGGNPFGGGAGAGGARRGPQGFDPGGMDPDLSDLFEGIFGGGGRQRQSQSQSQGGFGGFGRSAPRKGADVSYRLSVPFTDAALQEPQRVKLGGGKTIDMKLPAGVETGTKIRLKGQGQEGPGGAGDAIVTIKVNDHKFFERDGDNIRLDLPITLKEAVLGAKVKVPTVGGAVTMTIPKGSSSGTTLRLTGKGFTKKGGGRGNQLVRLMIEIPKGDKKLQDFVSGWDAPVNVRSGLGV